MGKEGGRSSKRGTYEAETPSGCVSAFFHLFEFHPFHFSLQQHQPQPSSISNDTTTSHIPKGTEAPRNSLESEDNGTTIMMGSISIEENLKIPKNKLFIKTRSTGIISSSNVNDLSPGTKTPTLVARLMGLDLLPDTAQSHCSSSPSHSSNSSTTTSSSCLSATKSHVHHHHHLRPRQHHNKNVVITKARHSMDDRIAASRFLPETPRRRSDVERHRLSLQINKENMGGEEDLLMGLPRFSFSKLNFEEHLQNGNINNKSPRQYAKQIVKQMKENVLSSRTVGTDVTNTLKNNREKKQEQQEGGGEFVVGQFMRNKKNSPRTPSTCSSSDELSSPGKVSNNPSCSSRVRFMDPKNNNKLSTVTTSTPKDQISPPQPRKLDNDYSRVLEEQEAHKIQKQKSSLSVPKCKKAVNEKFSPRLKNNKPVIRNKQDESFVRPLLSSSSDIKSTSKSQTNSSNHPLLINLLNLNNTVQIIHSNITTLPAAVNNKIPQKQVCDAREAKYCSSQLSSGSRQTYNTKQATSSSCIQSTTTTTTTEESNVDELDNKRKTMFNGPEFEYVSSILSRTGLSVKKAATTTTTVSVSLFHHQWLSSPPTQQQQPLVDPSIFHHLEQQQFLNQKQVFPSSVSSKYDVGLSCNRRLLFDLVNETLMSEEVVVGPYYDVEKVVWERIGRFQSNKKCEVLEDIDALIEMEDIMGKKMKMKRPEAMVAEIEGNIMDTLLHETVRTVSVVEGGGGTERTRTTTATTPFRREEEEKTRGGTCHVGSSRDGLLVGTTRDPNFDPSLRHSWLFYWLFIKRQDWAEESNSLLRT